MRVCGHVCVDTSCHAWCALCRVYTRQDLDIALDTLVLCHDAHVKFDVGSVKGATSTKLVNACCRADDARAGLHLLHQSKKFRLKPTGNAVANLVAYAAQRGDGELVKDAMRLFNQRGLPIKPKTLHVLVKCVHACVTHRSSHSPPPRPWCTSTHTRAHPSMPTCRDVVSPGVL